MTTAKKAPASGLRQASLGSFFQEMSWGCQRTSPMQIEKCGGQPRKKGWKSQREQHGQVMNGAKVHGMQENTY